MLIEAVQILQIKFHQKVWRGSKGKLNGHSIKYILQEKALKNVEETLPILHDTLKFLDLQAL